ncbi:thiamine-phosphate diphosphorylase [Abditibacterium utsteinense]|uniref:Thiamine-phosphate synthase n=1 Tax=Abditibacterium utsteinense TaxID=1960156 RepID=A0A2S8ST70_9BACT|nr:thiamine phosphate synthase [Abditibacterium utsteinense]PQV63995.1 thiamine-phosphate diphosphorylase [Abditibacterium utsteinense]
MQGVTEVSTPRLTDSFPLTPAPDRLSKRLRGLYVITDACLGGGHLSMARAALDGGAKILQLRDKNTPPRQILAVARQIRAWTQEKGALFLINDRIDLALLCEADGVHLGPDDWPISEARRVLGPQKIIGASTGTPAEARAAEAEGANYLGAGAVFGTQTKGDAGAPIGLDGLRAIALATSLPVAAIGGVNFGNIASTLAAGARMACVISALSSHNQNSIDSTKNEEVNQRVAMTQAARELVALTENWAGEKQ